MRAVGQPAEAPALTILAVSAMVGGGFFAYQAVSAMQAGGIFTVDEPTDRPPMTAFEGATTGAALLTAAYLTYEGLKDAAHDVGMEPLVLGGLGATAITGVIWLKNRLS